MEIGKQHGPMGQALHGWAARTAQKWCSGFTCLIVAQAARDLGTTMPFTRQAGVDALVADAKASGRLIKEKDVADPIARKSKVQPGSLFVVRRTSTDWTHVGIVLTLRSTTFDTFEGNTGGDGGTDGTNARQGNRSYAAKDFLRLNLRGSRHYEARNGGSGTATSALGQLRRRASFFGYERKLC